MLPVSLLYEPPDKPRSVRVNAIKSRVGDLLEELESAVDSKEDIEVCKS